MKPHAPRRTALALALIVTGAAALAAHAADKPVLQAASDARAVAELGGYGNAADQLRLLRRRLPLDPDLELSLALYEARAGETDSALARVFGPLLTAALHDSLPASRRHALPWQPESRWINGGFEGWHWYIARARAELAARAGRWAEARAAAELCVRARPLAGKEWLILAVASAHAGDSRAASTAAARALELDASLPEAHYLAGVLAWRRGLRPEAQTRFRRAVALDSSYRDPAVALVRSRLPTATPDSIPRALLSGPRETALVTSAARPKVEEFAQMDTPAEVVSGVPPHVPDSLKRSFQEAHLHLTILVDERGRVALHDLPWFDPAMLPEPVLGHVTEHLPEWRFKPATRHGAPHPVWTTIELTIKP